MRARNIKPGFWRNEDLIEVSPWARLLFVGLWMLADREGRLEDRTRRIKLELFPMDDVDIDAELDALQKWRFILRYEVDGERYIQIRNFLKHQKPHHNESQSTIPEPLVTKVESASDQGDKSGEPKTQPLRPERGILNPDTGYLSTDSSSSEVADAPRTPEVDSQHLELATRLHQLIRQNNPRAKQMTTRRLESWANDARLMVERDGWSVKEIEKLIEWCQRDDFWKTNILSMGKLREKAAQLGMKSGLIASNGVRGSPRRQTEPPPEIAELARERGVGRYAQNQ